MNQTYSTEAFEAACTYQGSDLGAIWAPEKTVFRVWAPTARAVSVNLYKSGTEGTDDLIKRISMTADIRGTWVTDVPGDLNGIYYTYQVTFLDHSTESIDPYARTAGVNGRRGMVLDLSATNPEGWEADADPHAGSPITDAIIYEASIRDLSSHVSSGIQHKGKFLGAVESGTHTAGGYATGLDHIAELGITHVQLMPVYDFGSVDESVDDKKQYNWGYDPANFNFPEGSYSTDPYDGFVRVREMKQMVKAFHDRGLSVVMDVVYNHVYHADDFCFNRIVPGYFSRPASNGSGCGNDTASERSMVRKFIVDSLNYWADEYHIDGFRFDLVGLLDTETIRIAMESVHRKHPSCLFYGEGWNMGTAVSKPETYLANQSNAARIPEFAFFNDTIRDCLRGSVFDSGSGGYVTGNFWMKGQLEHCFRGCVSWAQNPIQSINYVSCHDNNTLFDRVALAMPGAPREELIHRNNLAAAFCILSQGIPLMLSGEEMLRTKPGKNGSFVANSYRSPDSVNAVKWNTLKDPECLRTYRYYQGLIAFRKEFPVLRQAHAYDVLSSVFPLPAAADDLMVFAAYGFDYRLMIAFNAGKEFRKLTLPSGDWEAYIQGEEAGTLPLELHRENVYISPLSTLVLVQYKKQ